MPSIKQDPHARPVVFGEVLFDCFADGTRVLGGAPFNVAWHLKGFGLNPLFISRVGQDSEGELVISKMIEWGMDTRGIQLDAQYPTGRVEVKIENNEPSYDIVDDQAYDFINATLAANMVRDHDCSLLYYGTLATRQRTSREALQQIRNSGLASFVDINLREPWWDNTSVGDAVRHADVVKLNQHELAELLNVTDVNHDNISQRSNTFMQRYDVKELVVTFGEQGACLIDTDYQQCALPSAITRLVDTVGAGDAFSAATIYGMLSGWAKDRILKRALDFAVLVCQQQGATSRNREMYENFIKA
jgi:fructokinase